MTIGTLLLPRRIDAAAVARTARLPDLARLGLPALLIVSAYYAGGGVGLVLATMLAVLAEEWRRTRASLQRARADLAHAARVTAVGKLTASIVHEVNQPLTAIVTNAQACLSRLSAESPETGELREALQDVVSDGRRASDVIERVRGLMRKSPVRLVPLDVTAIVQDVLVLVRGELARRRISLRTDLAGELPSVRGDRVQLQQVLLNLIMNAAEAMDSVPTGSRVLTIQSRRDAGCVVVDVRDSGPGLAPSSREVIFDAFHTTKPDGLGVGLSVSRSIVDAHGGRLRAVPVVGNGAIFQLSLPTAA